MSISMFFFNLNCLFQAIQRLSRNDREVIKESCVILTRVFTTVEFKEKMEAFKEEPENLGLNILNEEEEIEETTFEEEIEMLNQTSLNKGIKIFSKDRRMALLTN